MVYNTEDSSHYRDLEKMSIDKILKNINKEDNTVTQQVKKSIPQIVKMVREILIRLQTGGRLFYIGAGSSGRLGVIDASEIPTTFGIPYDKVIALIAGGDKAIRKGVKFAEDSETAGWDDLCRFKVNDKDIVVGIAASGVTPYVLNALKICRSKRISTGCIVCNIGSPIATQSDYAVEVLTGPEFLTGSTRMKAGTAQKLVLNMISTSVMIKLGFVKGNQMIDMKLNTNKLIRRGIRMIMDEIDVDEIEASFLLDKFGSVREVIKYKS